MNSLELFYLLQSLIKDEEKSVDSYHIRECDIKEILEVRKNQNNNPHLNISIFDSLRNSSARNLRLKRVRKLYYNLFFYFSHFSIFFFLVWTNENTWNLGKKSTSWLLGSIFDSLRGQKTAERRSWYRNSGMSSWFQK